MDKISIIIPTFNRKEMLSEAIDSVLKQTYKEKEIIIVDDCSSDGTEEMLREKYNEKVNYYKNKKNSGCGFSRKLGYEKSTGKYIVFMDDDDIYCDNNFFEKAISAFNNNIAFVSANSKIKYEVENKIEYKPLNINGEINGLEYLEKFQFEYMKPNSTFTTVFSRECLKKGDFDKMEMVNDASIYLRALLAGNAIILEDVIGIYRVHSKNITFSIDAQFLIDNLEEKRQIYKIIKEKNLFDNSPKWWFEQIKKTSEYYIKNVKPNLSEYLKLKDWCVKNCDEENVFSTVTLFEELYKFLMGLKKIKLDKNKYKYKSNIKRYLSNPIVKSFDETLDKLVNCKASMSRYGDGEFMLIDNKSIGFQEATPELSQRLKEILNSESENHIIGIPPAFNMDLNIYVEPAKEFWTKYLRKNRISIYKLINKTKVYYTTNFTRFYIDYKDKSNCEYMINRIKTIWDNRDVVIIEGNKSRVGVGNDLFNNAKSLRRILCPSENAFEKYAAIYKEACKIDNNSLFLIALGPTATVLAYDLYKAGYQAIDFGHLDIEYEWFLRKATKKIKIENKYVNEVNHRKIGEITDKLYLSQIIAKI